MGIIYAVCIVIVLCLLIMRTNTIIDAFDDWNYYVHRYENYCGVNYSHEEKHPRKVRRNYVTKTEAIAVFFMFWKMDRDYFFSWKPDHDEILELYINKR